jgi:hypothetical protein
MFVIGGECIVNWTFFDNMDNTVNLRSLMGFVLGERGVVG